MLSDFIKELQSLCEKHNVVLLAENEFDEPGSRIVVCMVGENESFVCINKEDAAKTWDEVLDHAAERLELEAKVKNS